uniref:Ig-like domain-containing protein n=1 Tax=Mola mola TaxID=94237 RepID=A0A3Q4BA83_MOLML
MFDMPIFQRPYRRPNEKNHSTYVHMLLNYGHKDPEALCSSEPVQAVVKEGVTLLCHLEPPVDATNMTVEWEWSNLQLNHTVLLCPDRGSNHTEGRTSLSYEQLTKGDLSLTLSPVQLSDAGTYGCSFSTGCATKEQQGAGLWRRYFYR